MTGMARETKNNFQAMSFSARRDRHEQDYALGLGSPSRHEGISKPDPSLASFSPLANRLMDQNNQQTGRFSFGSNRSDSNGLSLTAPFGNGSNANSSPFNRSVGNYEAVSPSSIPLNQIQPRTATPTRPTAMSNVTSTASHSKAAVMDGEAPSSWKQPLEKKWKPNSESPTSRHRHSNVTGNLAEFNLDEHRDYSSAFASKPVSTPSMVKGEARDFERSVVESIRRIDRYLSKEASPSANSANASTFSSNTIGADTIGFNTIGANSPSRSVRHTDEYDLASSKYFNANDYDTKYGSDIKRDYDIKYGTDVTYQEDQALNKDEFHHQKEAKEFKSGFYQSFGSTPKATAAVNDENVFEPRSTSKSTQSSDQLLEKVSLLIREGMNEVRNDVQNLHVDLIKQAAINQTAIDNLLAAVPRALQQLTAENRALMEENERLRRLCYQ